MGYQPKVSIIVPVYNVAPYLQQCIDSLVSQTYSNIEIICVNDGSTDVSGEILEKYAGSDPRVKLLHTENQGVSSARNTALSQAVGDYVLFVDGDDWVELDTCEEAVLQATNHSADLVMWPYIREYPDHSVPKKIFANEMLLDKAACQDLQRRMIGPIGRELSHPENMDALVTVWGKLYRRDIIVQNRIAFTDLRHIGTCEDGLFNMQYLAYVADAVYIPKYLSHYRKNSGMTSKYKKQLAAQWKNLFSMMRDYIVQNDCQEEFFEALNNRISLSIIGLGQNAIALPRGEALTEVKNVLFDREYQTAIQSLPMRFLPAHWWIFFACCKLRLSYGVWVLLKCIKRMRR